MDLRNYLYDRELYAVYRADICVISVGNLTVGGTGKTPAIEFLIEWSLTQMAPHFSKTVILSRGYGRRTKGFRVAAEQDTAVTIGDEPLQLYRKFGRWVRVCVGERRADAIRQIRRQFPQTRQILLDDAFQHRAVRPQVNLLLTDYNRPFYTDHPFPAGRLREDRSGARRADAVIVTKCPDDLGPAAQEQIRRHIRPYVHPETPIFFAGLHYGSPMSFAKQQPADNFRELVLVSGLANADPLEHYVRQTFSLRQHRRFADHYVYSRADLDQLLAQLPPGAALLTTEKDWVKLDALLTANERARWPLYYLPVKMRFLDGQYDTFSAFMSDTIRKNC